MDKYVDRGRKPPHVIEDGDPLAVAFIKNDHQIFRALFDRIEDARDDALVSLANEACVRLAIHMTIEEEILYAALKPVLAVDKIDEGIVEHDVARRLIVELGDMTGREELYRSKVHVLGEETMHHIDEEDRGLLRDGRKAWEEGKVDLIVVGQQLRDRNQELYDLIGAIARDTITVDAEPVGEEVEEFPDPAASRSQFDTIAND